MPVSSDLLPGHPEMPSLLPAVLTPTVLLLILSSVQARMDMLQKFLSDSVNNNTLISKDRMGMVSTEISSVIHQVIVNRAALLACTQSPSLVGEEIKDAVGNKGKVVDPQVELIEDEDRDAYEIIELDAVELLAKHIHFCDIC